jgi:hypothetical protein
MAAFYGMKCEQKLPVSFHCGQPMHEEKVEEKRSSGVGWGRSDEGQKIPSHYERSMAVT